jgi:ABC-type nitrate/sulfonate/bicarbonate transport system substrate-binding protein
MQRMVAIPAALCFTLTSLLHPVAAPAAAQEATPQDKPLVLTVPGIPPIFASTIAVVADKQGYFKKYGVSVDVRPVDTGTTGARMLASGDADMSLSPTPLLVNQISNVNVDVVGIYGLPSPSFLLASTDPVATCKDAKGQAVGVDAIGGARANALREILRSCGLALADVQQVALPSVATQQAMIADVIKFGVLHFDEIPVIEAQGKPIRTVVTLNEVDPNSHFAMFAVRRARLAEHRDVYVRAIAGLIATARFMADAKNADRFADLVTRPGVSKDAVKSALKRFLAVNYWPTDDDGLAEQRLDGVIATSIKTGGIRPGSTPVTYDRLVDRSVWKDAVALVAKEGM